MTENEAIERLQCMRLFMEIEDKRNESKFLEDDYVANKMAIQALEELKAYRAFGTPTQIYEKIGGLDIELGKYHSIGTIEEFKALKEKSEPKKVSMSDSIIFKCPQCGSTDVFDYCGRCGCKIDWS